MPVGSTSSSVAATGSRAVRWAYGNADGTLVAKPGRLYYARLVVSQVGQQEVVALLRDGVTSSAPAILALDCMQGQPDDWPVIPVSMGFKVGLFVTFSGGTQTARLLSVGWETD